MGSGLGGGSSNAATTLVALNYLCKIHFSSNFLEKIGANLGCDIPLFIRGHTSFGEGKGDRLKPFCLLKTKWYLILYPNIQISTKEIFQEYSIKNHNKSFSSLSSLFNKPFKNDCEEIVRKKYSLINKLFLWLSQYATPNLTGTGSCVFAIFNKKKHAENVLLLIPKWTEGFISKGINASPLKKLCNSQKNTF
ncbi:4-(cytidine 5'-diphospho)-2-C-methyl-D-erythritol kinase [Candidatus Tachikawaea gelatinosa]